MRVAVRHGGAPRVPCCSTRVNGDTVTDVTSPTEQTSGSGNGTVNSCLAAVTYDTGKMAGTDTAGNDPAFPKGRHTDGSEFLLGDGHVKYFKPAAVSAGNNAVNPTTPESAYNVAPKAAAGTGLSVGD